MLGVGASADKDFENPTALSHLGHLLCYPVELSRKFGLQKFGPAIKPIYVNNYVGYPPVSPPGGPIKGLYVGYPPTARRTFSGTSQGVP